MGTRHRARNEIRKRLGRVAAPARLVMAVALVTAFLVGCSGSGSESSGGSPAPAGPIATLTDLLPADARGVAVVDLGSMLSGDSSEQVAALLRGEGGDPVAKQLFGAIGSLTGSLDLPGEVTTAMVGQTTNAADGTFLLAKVRGKTIDEVTNEDVKRAGAVGTESRAVYVDGDGHRLSLLPGGVLVVGTEASVASVVDVADGADPAQQSSIAPFLGTLDPKADITFAYGLPALADPDVKPDRTLRGAAVMSGALDVVQGQVQGEISFHTSNAKQFVKEYNALNRHAVEATDAPEEPLTVGPAVAKGLRQVVVTLPPSPLDATPADTIAVRNMAKKLFVGMEAHDYAEGVSSTGNPAWIDLIIKSEADGDVPPSPGAVFFRWEFKDRVAMDAFVAKELPPGFELAPTQFLTSDDPNGEYFLALMLYNAGGGSIVDGARAEWDVFVSPPKGADPDAPERPRYMIIQALSEKVSGDPSTLLTEASPVSYQMIGNQVVSDVRQRDGDREVPVFSSTFPKPDPATAKVARWTPEMAIANDYMHWPNGVYDHIVYNATTYNWDGYFIDPAQTTINDGSRWAQYLKPELKDATYYVNTLEYVASPLANLDSKFLDVTPKERADLLAFKDNGHQRGIMRGEVEKLFLGTDDAYVGIRVGNETPSTFYDFEITDPEGMAKAMRLPEGQRLAKTTVLEGGPAGYYLTLKVWKVDGATEGTRAEWTVYVDDGNGRPHQQVLDLMTADVGLDPVDLIHLPSQVRHRLADGVVRTRLGSAGIAFDASFATAGSTEAKPTLDWIETGDDVCYANAVCDKYFYDAETLDVPVHQVSDVTVKKFSTPWNAYVRSDPTRVFYRDNAQGYVIKRWNNLKVKVDVGAVRGLADASHALTGSGTLVGRTSTVANSTYTYTGDAVVDGDVLEFSMDQRVDNALGISHIYTSGRFDLATGKGTQTVVDCRGPALMCSDIEPGAEAPYTAQGLNASNRDVITWKVDVTVDLGSSFGTADSRSTFTATRTG